MIKSGFIFCVALSGVLFFMGKGFSRAAQVHTPAEVGTLPIAYPVAVLRVLNKISARVQKIEVPVGGQVVVGDLRVGVLSCTMMPPEEEPETAAYIKVYVQPILDKQTLQPTSFDKNSREPLFSGFMYAQSPSLNSLQNPFYDIWLVTCHLLSPAEK